MSDKYFATQGVGSFIAGEEVTGLAPARIKELLASGALITDAEVDSDESDSETAKPPVVTAKQPTTKQPTAK